MKVDFSQLITEMINEVDEKQISKNVDLLFKVCIPLYFLHDVSEDRRLETESVKKVLMNEHYQILIKKRLGTDTSALSLSQVITQFIQNPNDYSNNKQLAQIEKAYNGRIEFVML